MSIPRVVGRGHGARIESDVIVQLEVFEIVIQDKLGDEDSNFVPPNFAADAGGEPVVD